jgi:anti-sigma-K factor RskA
MTSGAGSHDDLEVLAGVYLCGLMDDAEWAAFEERLRSDASLRRAVAAARERFLELDLGAPPLAPSDRLWQRIESGLERETAPVPNLEEWRRRRLRAAQSARGASRRGFWQGFGAASLMALMLGILSFATLRPTQPRLIVVLLDADAKPVSIVEAFDGRKVRVVPLNHIDVPSGRTLQVWTLPEPAAGPVSLGLLNSVTATTLVGPDLPHPRANQLYEITLEPAGGSPTGRPTGPVIGKGLARVPQI